jgi:hypothetical protein
VINTDAEAHLDMTDFCVHFIIFFIRSLVDLETSNSLRPATKLDLSTSQGSVAHKYRVAGAAIN